MTRLRGESTGDCGRVYQALGFLGGSVVKNPFVNAGDNEFHPYVGKIPERRRWQPTPGFLPEKSCGQRSLVGYSPWGHRESDTTE